MNGEYLAAPNQPYKAHIRGMLKELERLLSHRPPLRAWEATLKLLVCLHDIGKLRDGWQQAIRKPAPTTPYRHSELGTLLLRHFEMGEDLQWIIDAHHDMTSYPSMAGKKADREYDEKDVTRLIRRSSELSLGFDLDTLREKSKEELESRPSRQKEPVRWYIWIRMLLGVLVDLDHTNASTRDGTPPRHEVRTPNIHDLCERFEASYARTFLGQSDEASDEEVGVNAYRRLVQKQVLSVSNHDNRIEVLSTDVGSGKTMAYTRRACEIQIGSGSGVITASPYQILTRQIASDQRDMVGVGNVLEDHGAYKLDPLEQQLVAGWTHPWINTTHYKLIKTLFSTELHHVRRLPSLIGKSVIIDEWDTIPKRIMVPFLRVMDVLNQMYDVHVILSSGTSPHDDVFDEIHRNIDCVRSPVELVPDDESPVEPTTIRWIGSIGCDDLAKKASKQDQYMIVCNKFEPCYKVIQRLTGRGCNHVYHISGMQDPKHVREIDGIVESRLEDDLPVILVATSTVESGRDYDFPRGFRSLSGSKSLTQTSGRIGRDAGGGTLQVGSLKGDSIDTKVSDVNRTQTILQERGTLDADVYSTIQSRSYRWCHLDGRLNRKIDLIGGKSPNVDMTGISDAAEPIQEEDHETIDCGNRAVTLPLYQIKRLSSMDKVEKTSDGWVLTAEYDNGPKGLGLLGHFFN